jgi:putative ABC transport system ATP-binding protein
MPDREIGASAVFFENIHLSLGVRTLFHDFSLAIHLGEKVVLVAPSGAGKTTLLRMVLGFVRPDGGRVLVRGVPVSPQTVRAVRHDCAYLSQDVDFRDMRVRDVIAEIAAYPANREADLSIPTLQSFFSELYLAPDTVDKRTAELSGGERQRLGIALCAALGRPVWLLDEPLSALDSDSAIAAADLIARSAGTVLAISHHPGLLDTGVFREVRF